MEVIDYTTVLPSRVGSVTLYALGDCHVGHTGCAMGHLKRDIAEIAADPNGHVILMGDLVDGIPRADKRFDMRAVHPSFCADIEHLVQDEVEWVVTALEPIKDKIICALEGNHEETAYKHTAAIGVTYDPHYEICKALGCKSMSYCGFLRWRFKVLEDDRQTRRSTDTIMVFAHHGYGGGRRPGGHAIALDDALDMVHADLFLMGHRHQSMGLAKVRLEVAARGKAAIRERVMKAAHTGAYLKLAHRGHANYAARRAYKPTQIGMCRVFIKPYHDDGACRGPQIGVVV